jgi:predicted transcriptional regulator
MRTGKPFTLWLPDDLAQRLEAAAAEQHRTKRVLVILALKQFLDGAGEAAKPPAKRKVKRP